MNIIINIIFLISLFYILSKAANFTIINSKNIAQKLGINMAVIGIILGLLTTLPEMSVGINSIINKTPELSFGNLLGGSLVIFCLIFGLSIVLNRNIKTDGKLSNMIYLVTYLFLPFSLSAKGYMNYIDGLILVVGYLLIFFNVLKKNKDLQNIKITSINKFETKKQVFSILLGVVTILISSSFIVKIALKLATHFNLSTFFIGIVIFSIGTNLPEIIIVIKSLKNKTSELSIDHLFGSVIANIFIIGLLSMMGKITLKIDINYLILMFFSFITLIFILIFYKTGKRFSKFEGITLILIYIIFLILQINYI